MASGTCLYARAKGDAIGDIVGNRPVELDDAGAGVVDAGDRHPWGPLAFAAHGVTRTDLAACAPPSTVPQVAPPLAAPSP